MFFIASIPGEDCNKLYGYKKVETILRENNCNSYSESWQIVAQISSIGNYFSPD